MACIASEKLKTYAKPNTIFAVDLQLAFTILCQSVHILIVSNKSQDCIMKIHHILPSDIPLCAKQENSHTT